MHYYSARGKFKAKSVTIDGITFPSKLEAKRYSQQKLLLLGGIITDLVIHPKIPIIINGTHCGFYTADSSFKEGGERVIEEVKGAIITDGFPRIWRILRALYPEYRWQVMRWHKTAFKLYTPR